MVFQIDIAKVPPKHEKDYPRQKLYLQQTQCHKVEAPKNQERVS